MKLLPPSLGTDKEAEGSVLGKVDICSLRRFTYSPFGHLFNT
jgi:hypothetical protein